MLDLIQKKAPVNKNGCKVIGNIGIENFQSLFFTP
jgi:hypothetical protein